MSQLILSIVALFKRRAWVFYCIAFVPMIAGLVTDRFIGGEPAWVAGRIQFIGLVTFFFFGLVYLLYRNRNSAKPLPRSMVGIFIVLTIISVYFVAFTAVSIVKHVS